MNVQEIELATRYAWPALEEEELSFGVLRYARGNDRRANCLSLDPQARVMSLELIEKVENFYRERRSTPIVRIVRATNDVPLALRIIDDALADRGYEKQSPTLTMVRNITAAEAQLRRADVIPERITDIARWLHAWYALTDKSPSGIDVHRLTLGKLDPVRLLLLNTDSEGELVATGLGVIEGSAVGVFGIATACNSRRQGHGRNLLRAILHWAASQGARYAYLQVEESNSAAIRLYSSLGFTAFYSYWYRVGSELTGDERRGE